MLTATCCLLLLLLRLHIRVLPCFRSEFKKSQSKDAGKDSDLSSDEDGDDLGSVHAGKRSPDSLSLCA